MPSAPGTSGNELAVTVRRLADFLALQSWCELSRWQNGVFHFTARRADDDPRAVEGSVTPDGKLTMRWPDGRHDAVTTGRLVAWLHANNTDWRVIAAGQPDAPQELDGTTANDDRQAEDDAGAARAQTGLFVDITPEEAAQEYLETQQRQRREAAGIDDRADGLPTIEEARTLVSSLARVVGDADGDVVTLQDALRRIATNSPNRLFAPPIFPALVKLRLDDSPEWERFKSMLGNSSPPGLAEAVRRRHDEVKRRRQQREARGRVSALANDPRFVVEPGPEIDRIVESLSADRDAALTADAIDALLDLQHRVDEAMTALASMADEDADADKKAVAVVTAALAEIVPAMLERFRQAGARVGRVAFRLALALHAGSGAAVIERIANQTPLPPDWRLLYFYDPQHLDEGVDFCAEVMALHPDVYWSGRPVVLSRDGESMPVLLPLTARALIDRIADRIDFVVDKGARTLPDKIGRTLLDRGASGHAATPRTIRGIASAPTLLDDGTLIGSAEGYEAVTCVFFASPPSVMVPERPTLAQAKAALKNLRDNFATFLHADPAEPIEGDDGLLRTDTEKPAGKNETVALMLMLTIVMRPVLDIVPGFLVCGALGSGSAAGKGKLVRAISLMTTAHLPRVVAHGNTPEESAKQTIAALLKGAAVTMFDNWNGARITDDTISSAISEPDYELRPLGVSILLPIPRTVLVFTGNDLAPGGDNTNRFMRDDFDPHSDHPEQRPFQGDVLEAIKERRPELLGSLLTIARWACQTRLDDPEGFNARLIERGGAPLATRFSRWDRMVRLPLLALGCDDPATRHVEEKAKDPIRQRISDVFWTWWSAHGADKKFAGDLHQTVQKMLVPEDEISPQRLGMAVRRLRGTRQDGFQLIEVATDEEARGRRKPRALWKLVWVGPPGEEPSREQAQQDGLPLDQPGWPAGTPPPWPEEATYDSDPEA